MSNKKLVSRHSDYKSVYKYKNRVTDSEFKYYGSFVFKGIRKRSKTYNNPRDCAKWVDLELIINGKQPVNILKTL